ncbi:hypothetical protein [Arthrobacter gengyunqii]|uniref:Uncharacterized protein n=1 Tax=Arthrobacter gengyunqii TaxID=2886940 RepID=A0ABS8GP30_9MICC|nr:hypothetical protein [Arthrobacter gengyunqii]MCC3267018.1 hypothetical protein [Arthrobacter gengyunqii]
MRNAVAVPALTLLFLTGCGAAAAEPGALPASGSATAAPSAETVSRDSEEQTCAKLLETNGEGPLYQSIYLLQVGDGTSGFGGSVETARTLGQEVHGIAGRAPHDMEAPLEELASPMDATVQRAENPDAVWSVTIETWQSAVAELLTRCAPHETGAAASPAVPAPVTADTTSAAYPGYPLIVDAASLDYRVAAWFSGRLIDGRVVALAPGLYAPYDPNVPDLSSYYTADRVAGDGVLKHIVFPGSGSAATWSGVGPGSQEPR